VAPLVPLVVAGGVEVVKSGGRGVIGKVVIGIILILVAVGGTKILIDQLGGSSSPKGKGAKSPAAGGGPVGGTYAVSERDRGGSCPDGTSFRNTLAQGQPGPTYNYSVRVVSDASSVSFGPTGGSAILTADLSPDGSFTGDSPVGSEYPVTGKFDGGAGPGATFEMEWTVRYGAGSCTTDLFGQWTSS
jgi:hypothetical protein